MFIKGQLVRHKLTGDVFIVITESGLAEEIVCKGKDYNVYYFQPEELELVLATDE